MSRHQEFVCGEPKDKETVLTIEQDRYTTADSPIVLRQAHSNIVLRQQDLAPVIRVAVEAAAKHFGSSQETIDYYLRGLALACLRDGVVKIAE